MEKLLLRDIRCFRGEHEAPLAPLTILVGENSTGKSTLLALARVAWDVAYGATEPDFNEEPFLLGAYEELAHYHGGRGKRTTSFSIGFSVQPELGTLDETHPVSVLGTFSAVAGQPFLSAIRIEHGSWQFGAHRKGQNLALSLTTPSEAGLPIDLAIDHFPFRTLNIANLRYATDSLRHLMPQLLETLISERELSYFKRVLVALQRERGTRPLAVAPIRSRPKRTYDPLRDVRSPEGEHIPMLLARLSTTDKKTWNALAEGLAAYGQASCLFDEVLVRRFGESESTPFQLRVKLSGHKKEVNLVDVGYGVSQILPIVIDALIEKKGSFFLMQQPEVHLHPRAQAELGTFLATLVKQRSHQFLVETHSDHLVDRIRLEVKRKTIKPESVAILFLERSGSQVHIHRLDLDSAGNIRNQPESYRRFFLEEELRIIS